MNPEVESCIRAGHAVETIYLTAADAGRWWPYWKDREAGVRSAYAHMAGVADSWTGTEVLAGLKLVRAIRLSAAGVSLVFIALPDGEKTGRGYASTGFRSLRKLWRKPTGSAITVDGVNSYSRHELIQTLAALIVAFGPDHIHIQDAGDRYGDDHADHLFGGLFAFAAHLAAAEQVSHDITSYRGYNIAQLPANLAQAEHDEKRASFFAYAETCRSAHETCLIKGVEDFAFRRYAVEGLPPQVARIRLSPRRCLTADAKSVTVRRCADGGTPAGALQKWWLLADGSIQAEPGRCLQAGSHVAVSYCDGRSAQRWTAFDDGQIRGAGGKCLTAGDLGAPAGLSTCTSTRSQRWQVMQWNSTAILQEYIPLEEEGATAVNR